MKRALAIGLIVALVAGASFAWGYFVHRNHIIPYRLLHSLVRGSAHAAVQSASEKAALESLGYVDAAYDPDHTASGVLIHDREHCFEGLNFYNSRTASEAKLVDMAGTVLHSWSHPSDAWQSAELLPNGDVLALVKENAVLRLDRDSSLLWSRPGRVHHDLSVYNDRIYVLNRRTRLIPEIHSEIPVLEDLVTVLDGDGNELEQISVLEIVTSSAHAYLLPAFVGERPGSKVAELDVLHTNHVEVFAGNEAPMSPLFAAGNMLLSCRTINAVFIVHGTSREILWLWGPSNLTHQHYPHLLDSGNILIFDNGEAASRVIEVDPRRNAVVWQYQSEGFFSRRRGAAERLGNGNTLITESDSGYVHEVTAGGDVVWRFANPDVSAEGHRSAIWRMTRVPENFLQRLR